ncbi:hypothetical protein [Neptuniibacter caesariensis]|uniref:Peptidase M16 C-terminal domain-containing protein n=1 Tax=Neptuniibacter caesariensis TaxID=207954 RepID=A0A7U8GSQ7_NEPCE|nr:hypothetical protein [Neptuniibacter caesariensis]EAR62757.1 hypothetical protein MED92_06548 [Oceanospirillum sp. MED92] [Neptuniibacter caesariensis]
MTNEYRPFFNRKQLTVLMWFSLLAIAVLSTMGPGPVEYQKISHSDNKTVYWMELEDQPTTLSLLLPTTPALNNQQRQLQQLKSTILQSRLREIASPDFSYQVTPKQDRIEITLRWASQQPIPDLAAIWNRLQSPAIAGDWLKEIKNIQARDYLNNQSTDQALLNQFYQQLQPLQNQPIDQQLSNSYAALFNAPRYAVSGEEAEEMAERIDKTLPQSALSQSTPELPAPTLQLSNDQGKQSYALLLGRTLPPRSAEAFLNERLAAQVIQDLLQEYKAQKALDFRMLWSALESSGYSAIILSANQNPGPLLPQLRQNLSDDLVEASQERLAQQWHDRMRDINNQVSALNLVAFYQLPTDTLEDYAEEILDLDEDQVLEIADKALQTSGQISILQSPSL